MALVMRYVVDGIDDEVDRHDIDPPSLDTDGWHPRRQQLPHALDQLEEIVRTVDLVHFAGLAVANDQAGPVDAPGDASLLPDDSFRIVLGLEIRMLDILGFLEHVLAEHALVQAGSGDRTDVLEAAGADRVGQRNRVARAVYVGGDLLFGRPALRS